jgi:class 3 adenylate cyclase
MEPHIQYAKTSDGVSIAYATQGKGRAVLVVPSMPLSHVQRGRGGGKLLAEHFRSIWYDSRGSGLSDRELIDFTMPAMLRDLEAVVTGSHASPCVLVALTDGVPIAITYAVAHPEQVSHLVLVDGWSEASAYRLSSTISAEEALRQGDWVLYTETLGRVLAGYEDPVYAASVGETIRACVEPEALREAYARQTSGAWDVADIVKQLTTPTLVLHNQDNQFLPVAVGQRLAASITGARFLAIEDMAHHNLAPLISQFISETAERTSSELPSGTAVILFADIADSTALTERMGDRDFRETARALDKHLRSAIREAGGTPVEGRLLGDGLMAVFSSAREAIDGALRCEGVSAESELQLRIGLHAGDVIREEGNVYGGAVNIAARVADAATPGEVFVSQTVRDIARTSASVSFEDRGERELKGVAEPVRVFAVRGER